jgi:hypothetical protein
MIHVEDGKKKRFALFSRVRQEGTWRLDFLPLLGDHARLLGFTRYSGILSLIAQSGDVQKIRYRSISAGCRWPITCEFQVDYTRYLEGAELEEHRDRIAKEERQYRVMLLLKKAKRGGELISERFIVNLPRLKIFEPCRYNHRVTKIEEGERVVLLLGFRFAFRSVRPCPF